MTDSNFYYSPIAASGLVFIPAGLRYCLSTGGDEWILTADPNNPALLLYSREKWDILVTEIMRHPITGFGVQRGVVGHATEINICQDWKFTIPASLLALAKWDMHAWFSLTSRGVKIEAAATSSS